MHAANESIYEAFEHDIKFIFHVIKFNYMQTHKDSYVFRICDVICSTVVGMYDVQRMDHLFYFKTK